MHVTLTARFVVVFVVLLQIKANIAGLFENELVDWLVEEVQYGVANEALQHAQIGRRGRILSVHVLVHETPQTAPHFDRAKVSYKLL